MSDDEKIRVNPDYALDQLARALRSEGEPAQRRARQWKQVLAGMFSGKLAIGSRAPVRDIPPWVTLEVVHGGFATGGLAAGGPLLDHERARLETMEQLPTVTDRALLNGYFITDQGRDELAGQLTSNRYRVDVPEEAALPVIQWLIQHGETERAHELLTTIAPFWDRLRFYPSPTTRARTTTDNVFVEPTTAVVAALRAKKPNPQVAVMKEAITVWAPLYDRVVALFLETVEGPTPDLAREATGQLARRSDGQPIVRGGWPCASFPSGWADRGRGLLSDYDAARESNRLSGKPVKAKENFARLRGFLAQAVQAPSTLTGRDVGLIRKILASFVAKHGAPASPRLAEKRRMQQQSAAKPEHTVLANVVADRIERRGATDGHPNVLDELGALTPIEATAIRAEAGVAIPQSLAQKAKRCLEAPIETLIQEGVVRSDETLARLLPPLTAKVRAQTIESLELRRLYEDSYVAFRRRRSLLLLNLESQVRFEELPWIRAIAPWIGSDTESRSAARAALVRATRNALVSFPQTLLPNTLVRELRTLARAADESPQLVDELAADIFMGTFSGSYLRAAQQAIPYIAGTIYEDYYGLPLDRITALNDISRGSRGAAATSGGFARICHELAGVESAHGWSAARNGTVIEQAQILTTHNLAQLVGELGLAAELPLTDLARMCFSWICQSEQRGVHDWQAQMQSIRNSAYAWRQMLFYLSIGPADALAPFVDWAADHLSKQRPEFRTRFAPAYGGLRLVSEGGSFDSDGMHDSGARRFLGWSVGPHWLLPDGGEEQPA